MRQNKAGLALPAQASARAVFCHSMRLDLAAGFYALRIANWQLMGSLHLGDFRALPRQWLHGRRIFA